ncbi:hypothetical protein [Rhizobium sp. Root708]|uniref:hypothetical protein n=1 Tax=Rhizobium sp. Root708 TaxID=1736592 RepID=UPI000A460A25|nr:hypothetical protein [Rhizobium sp. Root708]
MDASEALLRAFAWRLAFCVLAIVIARTVPDNRSQQDEAAVTSISYPSAQNRVDR